MSEARIELVVPVNITNSFLICKVHDFDHDIFICDFLQHIYKDYTTVSATNVQHLLCFFLILVQKIMSDAVFFIFYYCIQINILYTPENVGLYERICLLKLRNKLLCFQTF